MSSSKTDSQRLDRLRAGYRAAFREWISARNFLGGAGRSADTEQKAQAHEVAAALSYRSARNHLTDAMLGLDDRDVAGSEKRREPSPSAEGALSLMKASERREMCRDFVLALMLIGLAVAGGALLSVMDFSAGGAPAAR